MRSVWIGYDTREALSFLVARSSIHKFSTVRVEPLALRDLTERGIYTRKTRMVGPRLFDEVSGAPMSTEFANARFFVPWLVKRNLTVGPFGWHMFVDGDILCRASVDELFSMVELNPDKALYCVPHEHKVMEFEPKKDKQVQLNYNRKNWSSMMLFNVDHPSNRALTLDMLNTTPGRDLHAFCWLRDDEIGFVHGTWNWLVDISPPDSNPAIVHFTNGGPWLEEYKDVSFADEWRDALHRLIHLSEHFHETTQAHSRRSSDPYEPVADRLAKALHPSEGERETPE